MESREGRFLQKVLDKFNLVKLFLEKVDDDNILDDFLMRRDFLADTWNDYKLQKT